MYNVSANCIADLLVLVSRRSGHSSGFFRDAFRIRGLQVPKLAFEAKLVMLALEANIIFICLIYVLAFRNSKSRKIDL